MALNDNAPYSGEVETMSVAATNPGTVVTGGTLTVNPQVSTTDGIGMQRVSWRSYYTGEVTAAVTHPALARLSEHVRASATNSLATKAVIVGTADGRWNFATAMPCGFTSRCAVGEALTADLTYWGVPAQDATSAGSMGSTAGIAAEATRFYVDVDSTDYYVQSWEVSLDGSPYWFNAQNNSAASSAPTAVLLGIQNVSCRLSCAKQFPDANASYTADTHDADIDIVIGAVDSSDTSILKFTLSDMCTPTETGTHNVGSLKVWDYDFQCAKQIGAFTVAAS